MNVISLSEFKRLGSKEMSKLLPLTITADGEVFCYMDKPENIICLSDLHPRVRTSLKAMESKARVGMPMPITRYADEVHAKAAEDEQPTPEAPAQTKPILFA